MYSSFCTTPTSRSNLPSSHSFFFRPSPITALQNAIQCHPSGTKHPTASTSHVRYPCFTITPSRLKHIAHPTKTQRPLPYPAPAPRIKHVSTPTQSHTTLASHFDLTPLACLCTTTCLDTEDNAPLPASTQRMIISVALRPIIAAEEY